MFGLGSIWAWIGGALALLAVGAFGGYKAGEFIGSRQVAQERVLRAQAETKASDAQKTLADFRSQAAQEAARASAQALQAQTALAAELSRARASIAQAETARQRASQRLLEALHAVPKTEVSPLSVGAVQLYASMRERQAARAGGNN